jgi:hypothetical protein
VYIIGKPRSQNGNSRQGINYTREIRILDVGSVHITTKTHEQIPLPPILGGLALVGGFVLVVMGAKDKS